MLSDCKIGDWVLYDKSGWNKDFNEKAIGIVIDIINTLGFYKLQFKLAIYDNIYYSLSKSRLNGNWHPNTEHIVKYQPTIEEIFKIKQLEKD